MKLARFSVGGQTRLGKVMDDQVVDTSTVVPEIGDSMRLLVAQLDSLRAAVEDVNASSYPLSRVVLEGPIAHPTKFLAIGMNYHSHVDEPEGAGHSAPKTQICSKKQVSCITGPFANVDVPRSAPAMVD